MPVLTAAPPTTMDQPVSSPAAAPSLERSVLRPSDYLAAGLFGLAVRAAIAFFMPDAASFDATYHVIIGKMMATGQGLVEPFVWQLIAPPSTLIHPSHEYWMPLGSLLIGLAMSILGTSVWVAMVPNALFGALIPVLTAWYAQKLGFDRKHSLLAAVVSLLTGLNPVHWSVPDPFAIYAVFAAIALIASDMTGRRSAFVAGLTTGVAQLARADAVLLLVPLGIFALARRSPSRIVLAGLGFLLAFGAWGYRNYQTFGAVSSPGGVKSIYLREYNDFFRTGGTPLDEYLGRGAQPIITEKLGVFATNLANFAATQQFILTPFAIYGIFLLLRRRNPHAVLAPPRSAILYLIMLTFVMSFVFTYPGLRGSYLHSVSALAPLFAIAVVAGMAKGIERFATFRHWRDPNLPNFATGMLIAGAIAIAFMFGHRVAGNWHKWYGQQQDNIAELQRIAPDAIVSVTDPGTYTYLSGRPSVIIPNEPIEQGLETLKRYGATYIALDTHRPGPWTEIYQAENPPYPFVERAKVGETRIFEIVSLSGGRP